MPSKTLTYLIVTDKGGVFRLKASNLGSIFDKDHLIAKRFVEVADWNDHSCLIHIDSIYTVNPQSEVNAE